MKKIIEYLKNTPQRDIIVIGDLMLDEYIFGTVDRISPEAPVPILHQKQIEWSLGGAANVALNCKHIGGNVTLIGIINDHDQAGKTLRFMLEKNGLGSEGIIASTTRTTTCKKRIIAQNHQLLRIDSEDHHSLSFDEKKVLLEKVQRAIKPHSILVLSDYAKGIIDKEIINTCISYAKIHECLVLVDPKGPRFDKYYGADYIKPNFKEFNAMIHFFGLEGIDSFEEKARSICTKLNIKGLIITMGERGMHFVSDSHSIAIPAVEREVFDLTGAGDTVIAFLAFGLLNNIPLETCLQLANRAAAVAISHVKTYAVSLDEIERTL